MFRTFDKTPSTLRTALPSLPGQVSHLLNCSIHRNWSSTKLHTWMAKSSSVEIPALGFAAAARPETAPGRCIIVLALGPVDRTRKWWSSHGRSGHGRNPWQSYDTDDTSMVFNGFQCQMSWCPCTVQSGAIINIWSSDEVRITQYHLLTVTSSWKIWKKGEKKKHVLLEYATKVIIYIQKDPNMRSMQLCLINEKLWQIHHAK